MTQNNDIKFNRSFYQAVHVKQPTSVFTFHNFLNSDTEGIDKVILLNQTDTLLKNKRIDHEEHNRLKEMINSVDRENLEIAKMIVDKKQNELGISFYDKIKKLFRK